MLMILGEGPRPQSCGSPDMHTSLMFRVLCSLPQVCVVAYLGLFMLCVSYQVDERTCVQFSMKVSCFSFFQNHYIGRNVSQNERVFFSVTCLVSLETSLSGSPNVF